MTDWTYQIIGDGSLNKYLQRLAHQLNLNDQVSFIGACDHQEVYRYLYQADVFILPSYREAFGIAYLEAMACGLLTIGVKEQGPQDFIEHGNTGFLVEPNSADALVHVIKNIFRSPNEMLAIANHGKQHVHNYFTWKSHAKNLENVYQEALTVTNNF